MGVGHVTPSGAFEKPTLNQQVKVSLNNKNNKEEKIWTTISHKWGLQTTLTWPQKKRCSVTQLSVAKIRCTSDQTKHNTFLHTQAAPFCDSPYSWEALYNGSNPIVWEAELLKKQCTIPSLFPLAVIICCWPMPEANCHSLCAGSTHLPRAEWQACSSQLLLNNQN